MIDNDDNGEISKNEFVKLFYMMAKNAKNQNLN